MSTLFNQIKNQVLLDRNLIRPHVKAYDFSHLNFAKMKEMGMEKVLIKNVNVLTEANK